MTGNEFVFDSVDTLYYKLHKISLNRGGWYIDSPKWSKNKKATINPQNNDDKWFHCAVAAALNHEEIKCHPERISNIKHFIDQYNWKEMNFSSKKTGMSWKKIINQLLLIFCMYLTILKK